MTFLERAKSYHKSEIRKEQVLTKKWFLFKWEIAIVIGLALLAVILNQIPVWTSNVDAAGKETYPLRTDIIYSSISIFITVGIAIFIGVFTEIGKMAGKFGSAIFILVPAFVWVLSERKHDPMAEEIIRVGNLLGEIFFWMIIAVAIIFIVVTIIKMSVMSMTLTLETRLKIELLFNYFMRFLVVLVNVVIVLLVSYSFINYAIFSLHLADITPADAIPGSEMEEIIKQGGVYSLEKESFKVFHVVITILFSVLMVLIGLSTSFTENIRGEGEEEPEWGFIEHEHKEEELAEKELEASQDAVANIIDISLTKELKVEDPIEDIRKKEVTNG